jgi:hypothetical protein
MDGSGLGEPHHEAGIVARVSAYDIDAAAAYMQDLTLEYISSVTIPRKYNDNRLMPLLA